MPSYSRPPAQDNAFVDYFCGLSGSGEGLRMAGFDLRAGVNHWEYALEMFAKHHTTSEPILTDISKALPSQFPRTRFKWGSCECDTHSNARGTKEVKQQLELFATKQEDPAIWRSRVTAWDTVYLAFEHDPDVFVIENVAPFAKWEEYEEWLAAWRRMGYTIAELSLNSQFFGVAQSRDRLYIVMYKRNPYPMRLTWTYPAWCSQCETIVEGVQYWKDPQKSKRRGVYGSKHGQYIICCPHHVKPTEVFPATVPAASIINFTRRAEPMYGRKKPLKPKTIARVRKGIQKYGRVQQVVDLARGNNDYGRSRPAIAPLFTQTQAQTFALVDPLIIANYSPGWARSVADPLGTITSTDHHALVVRTTHADEHNGKPGGEKTRPVARALPTLTSRQDLAVVHLPFLVKLDGNSTPAEIDPAILASTHTDDALSVAQHSFLGTYNGNATLKPTTAPVPTLTQVERVGMVQHPQVNEPLTSTMVEEILEQSTFRMLEPDDELLPAMDLARYKLEGTRRNKTAAIGNAVIAEMARQIGLAIRAAYYGPDEAQRVAHQYPARQSYWLHPHA